MFKKDLDQLLAEQAQLLAVKSVRPAGKRRWYDKHENVNSFITRISLFPMRIQEVLCMEIADAVEDLFRLQELESNRSIGIEKILRLWGAKRKQRGYDNNQALHRVVTYLSIIPEVHCEQVAEHSNTLVDKTLDHLKDCVQHDKPVLITEVRAMSQEFFKQAVQMSPLREGSAFYKRVVEQLEAEIDSAPKSLPMPQQMSQTPAPSEMILPGVDKTWVDIDGMRIRGSRTEPGWT